MSKEFEGKVALVTGASKGIGKGIAICLAKEGANVVVNYNSSEQAAKNTVEEITKLGVKAIAVKADISKISDIKFLFQETIKKFGKIDIVVNNAGIVSMKPIVEFTEEEYDAIFNANTKGTFFCLQEAAKVISESGRIINISTCLTQMALAGVSLYSGSKAAVEQFTKSLALELAPKKVTVNVVNPGPIDTDMSPPNLREYYIKTIPFKRLGTPEDIANIVAFLASRKAEWITGQIIHANGGFSMV